MSIKNFFRLAAVILVILILFLCLKRKFTGVATTHENPTNSISSSQNERPRQDLSNAPTHDVGVTPTQLPPPNNKDNRMQQGLAALNDEDVVLYGKVVDQFGLPVAGASIVGTILIKNGFREGAEKLATQADAEGKFTISGHKGATLGIGILKQGYAIATTQTSFVYSLLWSENERHHPDSNNPVIFKMWKLQGAEPLTGIDQRYKFPFTPEPVYFDLLAKKMVTNGGDIKMTFTRSSGIVAEQTLQDWGVKIEPVNGGLILTSFGEAHVTYELPDTGYEPSMTFAASTNTHWNGVFNGVFFMQSRNGQVFFKLNVSVAINRKPQDQVAAEIHGLANTNASRNFEGSIQ